MTIRHGEEFEIKFTDLIEDRYEKVIERLYNGNVTNYFCVVKDGDVMVINLYGTTNGRAKEIAGDLASMFAYKIDADIVLSIFTHKNNVSLVYTEPDGKEATKVGIIEKTPDGKQYVDRNNETWVFGYSLDHYITPWNKEGNDEMEQLINQEGPSELINQLKESFDNRENDGEVMVTMNPVGRSVESILKTIFDEIGSGLNTCQCEKCRRERGEIIESGSSINAKSEADMISMLERLEVPDDKDKFN